MLTQKEKELYGNKVSVIKQFSEGIKYQIECDTPTGYMECYQLFPGVDLAYTTFQASSSFMREKTLPNILEIAYCKSGRFECEYKHGYFSYLGEGDFAVSVLSRQQEQPAFPMGYYDGIAIIVDMEVTGECFSNVVEGISINLKDLTKKFCSDRCCSVIKANPALLHVFNEIYDAQDSEKLGYLRLKVLEIFFLLAELIPKEDIKTSAYYSGIQVKKIKALKAELMENLDTKILLKNLASRYDLSLTTMKDCFKAIYGKPIYTFQREYKMQMATKLLITTDLSISEISGRLGYENPNKFSTAFKSIIDIPPSDYRAQNK